MTTVIDTKGHLSAKLVIKNEAEDTETWLDYDTRLHDCDPEVGTIYVFNSMIGQYEPCSCLADAKVKFEEHYERRTFQIPDETEIIKAKREELKESGKHLRNITPFIIGPGKENDPS